MKPSVDILGYYGHQNIGDDAYKLSFPILLPNYTLNFVDKLINPTKTVVLGGGNVINNYFLGQLARFPNITKYTFSVNATPDMMEDLFPFKQIICRNNLTGFPKDTKIMSLPDFAFVLEPNPKNGRKLIEKIYKDNNLDLYANVVIIVLNSFLCNREYGLARDYVNFEKVCYDLAHLMDHTSASFLLLPFGNSLPQNDRLANANIYMKCKWWRKNAIVFDMLSVQETLDICSSVQAVISTRLHSSIFSCIGGTPFVDLTHHNKTKLFLDYVDRPDWSVDYWHLSYEKLKFLLDDFLLNQAEHREKLSAISKKNREMLLKANLAELIG